jgi:hypothetical protein
MADWQYGARAEDGEDGPGAGSAAAAAAALAEGALSAGRATEACEGAHEDRDVGLAGVEGMWGKGCGLRQCGEAAGRADDVMTEFRRHAGWLGPWGVV